MCFYNSDTQLKYMWHVIDKFQLLNKTYKTSIIFHTWNDVNYNEFIIKYFQEFTLFHILILKS